jgi:homoserine O-acetyltransferase
VAIVAPPDDTFVLELPDLQLEGGGVVREHRTRVWRRGDPSLPALLFIHALTGDARAGGEGGWWSPLIGPGLPFDPDVHQLVCVNNLGSVYGASNPDADGARGSWPADARITVVDQARAIAQALERLGIERLHLVAGGSLGGEIAYALAALQKDRVERLLIIAAVARVSPWVIAFNHVQRQLLTLGASVGGDGADGAGAARGLEVARQLAMITYRAERGFERTQPRGGVVVDERFPHRVEGYLEHQGRKLRDRFTPGAYRTQLDAMDSADVDLAAISASALVVAIDTDVLYRPESVLRAADELARHVHVETATLTSDFGHDGFLIEWTQLQELAARALRLRRPATATTVQPRLLPSS